MQKVTMKDVAKLAGVSTSTVSRVVSDDDRISQDTKEKVLEVMEKLNYYPNSAARSLANKETEIIGLVMPSYEEDIFINPFFQEVLKGVSSITSKNSFDILIATNHEGEDDLDVLKRIVQTQRVDGLILTRSKKDDEGIKYSKEHNIPFVLIGSCLEYDDIPAVDNDNKQAAYNLTSLLINKGRRKIAFISGEINSIVTLKRYKGYLNALQEHDIEVNDDYFISDEFLEESGYKLMSELLKLNDKPDAIVCADDLICVGVLKRIKESKKYNVPEDIMLASFNNTILAKYSNPTITSVDINSVQLGKKASKKLINNLNKKSKSDNSKEILDYKIIKRDSTLLNNE
ncbi:substrate-binding domain-containing protein [Halanaerobacter jeridensis]|uniref:DNA-binding LacI/PurR family transcriptional regulator n=1 Tax=Halanaerobacter jeridensis TaxID=706427 RepID=A0A938XRH4_9FIRM|nr:DNA-binding LacI/PurR family transcriptional regulator [Halanaerobacter jeridensis]